MSACQNPVSDDLRGYKIGLKTPNMRIMIGIASRMIIMYIIRMTLGLILHNYPPTTRRTCFELKSALRLLKIKQVDLASGLGCSAVQVGRWVSGDSEVPAYVWSILGILAGADRSILLAPHLAPRWPVEARDIYRLGKTYDRLMHDFRPGRHKRNVSYERTLIDKFRPFQPTEP